MIDTMTQDEQIRKMVLAWPLEVKLNSLKELVQNGQLGTAIQISQILLEAPMSEGGVSSELIQEAMMG